MIHLILTGAEIIYIITGNDKREKATKYISEKWKMKVMQMKK